MLLTMLYGIAHEVIFINAHFLALLQNYGEIKVWWIKLWRISYQPQSFLPPMFCAIRYIIIILYCIYMFTG